MENAFSALLGGRFAFLPTKHGDGGSFRDEFKGVCVIRALDIKMPLKAGRIKLSDKKIMAAIGCNPTKPERVEVKP